MNFTSNKMILFTETQFAPGSLSSACHYCMPSDDSVLPSSFSIHTTMKLGFILYIMMSFDLHLVQTYSLYIKSTSIPFF